jgi:hypothetical protein
VGIHNVGLTNLLARSHAKPQRPVDLFFCRSQGGPLLALQRTRYSKDSVEQIFVEAPSPRLEVVAAKYVFENLGLPGRNQDWSLNRRYLPESFVYTENDEIAGDVKPRTKPAIHGTC